MGRVSLHAFFTSYPLKKSVSVRYSPLQKVDFVKARMWEFTRHANPGHSPCPAAPTSGQWLRGAQVGGNYSERACSHQTEAKRGNVEIPAFLSLFDTSHPTLGHSLQRHGTASGLPTSCLMGLAAQIGLFGFIVP